MKTLRQENVRLQKELETKTASELEKAAAHNLKSSRSKPFDVEPYYHDSDPPNESPCKSERQYIEGLRSYWQAQKDQMQRDTLKFEPRPAEFDR